MLIKLKYLMSESLYIQVLYPVSHFIVRNVDMRRIYNKFLHAVGAPNLAVFEK